MPDCFDGFKAALKNDFSDDDIEAAINSTKDAIATARSEGANLSERLNQHADDLKEQHKFAEAQREFMWWRQQEVVNKVVKLISNFRGRKNVILKAITSYIDGTQFNVEGSRDSFSLFKYVLHNKVIGSLFDKIIDSGKISLWNSKQFQEDFVRAMETGEHENPDILALGNAVNELKALTKKLDNSNGIFHRKLEGRFFKNFHSKKLLKFTDDSFDQRMQDRRLSLKDQRDKAFNRWKDYVLPRLDIGRSFGNHLDPQKDSDEINDIMSKVYDQLIDQKEFKGNHDDIVSLSRKQRILIWKEAKGAVEYNEKFGTGHTSTAIEAELQSVAQRNATLARFSDKPMQTIQAAILRAEKIFPDLKGDFDKEKDFNKIKRLYLEARGVTQDPNSNLAKISRALKTFNMYTKLGSSFFRLLTDLAPTTIENKRIHGNFLKSMNNTIGSTIKGLNKENRKKFGSLLNSTTTATMGGNARTFMDQGATVGSMSKMQRLYFKLALHHPWDAAVKTGKAVTEARHLATNKHLSFEDMKAQDTETQKAFAKIGSLPPGESNVKVLKSYNITGDMWDAFRSSPSKLIDGKNYLLPESAQNISDETITKLLNKEGIKNFESEGQKRNLIQRKKDDIQDKFEGYIEDRIDHSIFRPGAADKLRLFMNTQQGSTPRMVMSLINQFRMYGLTWVTKGLAPHIYGKGADSVWESLFRGKADYISLVQMMAYSWALAYAGKAGLSLTKGESIPNPFDSQTIQETAFEGLGLYADAIGAIGKKNEFGTYSSIFGPNAQEIVQSARLITSPLYGRWSSLQGVNYLQNNLPFRLFWLRYGLDYLLFNRMKEAVHPGYFQKKKAELKKHGQHYILPPT